MTSTTWLVSAGARALSFAVLMALAVPAAAAPPGFTVQGRLSDAAGVGRNGAYDVQFTIYDAATAGSALWTRKYTGLSVRNGNFAVIVADLAGQPKLADVFAGDSRFLEIQVLAGPGIANPPEPPMSPRQQLVSVPYALKAQFAESVPAELRVATLTVTGAFSAAQGVPPDFDSGFVPAGAHAPPAPCPLNSICSINHRLGVIPRRVTITISRNADGSGWNSLGGQLIYVGGDPFAIGVGISDIGPVAVNLRVAEAVAFTHDGNGQAFRFGGYLRVQAWK